MIQTYNDIGSQIRQFETSWNGEGQLQKVYSSARFISVSLRSMGKTVYLYLGRGKGYEGFWLGETQIPSVLRKKDQLLEYMRKHISGARLLGVKQDPEDRVIYIEYQKFGKLCVLGFFYHGRLLYFANCFYNQKSEQMAHFKSWEKGVKDLQDLEEVFREVGKKPQDTGKTSGSVPEIQTLMEQELKEGLKDGKGGRKKARFAKRKIRNIEGDLDKNRKWPLLLSWLESQDDLESIKSPIQVEGFKVKFKEKSHFKRRDEVYSKIKKLKKGERIQQERLKEAKNLEISGEEALSSSSLEVIKPVWPQKAPPALEKKVEVENGYKVYHENGLVIAVGVTAGGNDQLRKNWAKKNDWWFHLDGDTSPHIIVKVETVTGDVLEKVAARMKKSAQTQGDEINLLYTQVKNIKGITGKPGSVIFKKEKRVRVFVTDSEGN